MDKVNMLSCKSLMYSLCLELEGGDDKSGELEEHQINGKRYYGKLILKDQVNQQIHGTPKRKQCIGYVNTCKRKLQNE